MKKNLSWLEFFCPDWNLSELLQFQQLQILLTLFSEFFSSFLHSTCSLSVSHRYLALDGVYHLFWAALSSNSTPLPPAVSAVRLPDTHYGSLTLYAAAFHRTWCILPLPYAVGFNTTSLASRPNSRLGLSFPFHSPLLWKSLLFSFPPLIKMLQFSGCTLF